MISIPLSPRNTSSYRLSLLSFLFSSFVLVVVVVVVFVVVIVGPKCNMFGQLKTRPRVVFFSTRLTPLLRDGKLIFGGEQQRNQDIRL